MLPQTLFKWPVYSALDLHDRSALRSEGYIRFRKIDTVWICGLWGSEMGESDRVIDSSTSGISMVPMQSKKPPGEGFELAPSVSYDLGTR